jgi:hypothetical protein
MCRLLSIENTKLKKKKEFVGRRTVINNYYLLSVTIFRIPQRAKTVLLRLYETYIYYIIPPFEKVYF